MNVTQFHTQVDHIYRGIRERERTGLRATAGSDHALLPVMPFGRRDTYVYLLLFFAQADDDKRCQPVLLLMPTYLFIPTWSYPSFILGSRCFPKLFDHPDYPISGSESRQQQ